MACILSTGRKLPCKDSVGGIKAIYFADFGTLGALTIGTNGQITAIAGTTLNFFKYDVKSASNLEQKINQDANAGTTFYEQTITMSLAKLDPETRMELQTLIVSRPHAFVADNNGNFLAVGLTRGCDVTGGSISTGSNLGDMSGFSLTITASEPLMASFVSASAITAHTAVAQLAP